MTLACFESPGDGHRLPASIAGLNLLTRPIWVFDPVIVAAGGPPVIMVSANALPEHRDAALAAGALSHVVKPIEPARLIEEVATVVVEARLKELSSTHFALRHVMR